MDTIDDARALELASQEDGAEPGTTDHPGDLANVLEVKRWRRARSRWARVLATPFPEELTIDSIEDHLDRAESPF